MYGVIHEYEFPQEAIEIIIDRFLYGAAQERFDNYLADGLMRSINVSHLDSKQCPCLQSTDFIAGAIALNTETMTIYIIIRFSTK
ncbi:MAG TPA: DUF3800 domain-containing protein [Methanothrix sp.]|uniref:DUF3800 domain-containing protein n=1 Tax=Methanothrix sp. TaxID=90426 RepID=UPI002CB1134C|nr:DUF3800 domain-containing protein [Methanothrix sp.]MDI9418076.1 DUF3800 domain-containing protein [Euryarchaeota archaeon]HON36851.1 DUF3800 domain-containing protein [Methanothrix sp.]